MIVQFATELWLWDVRRADSWTFVTLPVEVTEDIRDLAAAAPRRGFDSMRVRATVGRTTWTTSVFPDTARGYVLPLKRAVRTAEALDPGDTVTLTIELIDS